MSGTPDAHVYLCESWHAYSSAHKLHAWCKVPGPCGLDFIGLLYIHFSTTNMRVN